MIDAKVQSFVSALFDRRALDDDILRLANELFQERDAIDRVRQAWPDSDLPIIANYLCCKRLGHGSSGVVFKALRFNQPPEWVALKVLRHVTDQDTVRFIEREVEILKALECPNVARYLDSGHYAGSHYLAMELVEGIPLDEYVQDPSLSI